MSIEIVPRQGTLTAASGSANVSIDVKNGLCHQIFVKATTGSTTFDVSIQDVHGNDIYSAVNVTGELNDLSIIPSYENWLLSIDNASADEDFDYVLALRTK